MRDEKVPWRPDPLSSVSSVPGLKQVFFSSSPVIVNCSRLFLLHLLTVSQEHDCPVLFPCLGFRQSVQYIFTQRQCQYILYTV